MQAQSKIEFSPFSADTLHAAISGTWEIDSKSLGPGEVLNRLAAQSRILGFLSRELADAVIQLPGKLQG